MPARLIARPHSGRAMSLSFLATDRLLYMIRCLNQPFSFSKKSGKQCLLCDTFCNFASVTMLINYGKSSTLV